MCACQVLAAADVHTHLTASAKTASAWSLGLPSERFGLGTPQTRSANQGSSRLNSHRPKPSVNVAIAIG
jgi:hypothetical protein